MVRPCSRTPVIRPEVRRGFIHSFDCLGVFSPVRFFPGSRIADLRYGSRHGCKSSRGGLGFSRRRRLSMAHISNREYERQACDDDKFHGAIPFSSKSRTGQGNVPGSGKGTALRPPPSHPLLFVRPEGAEDASEVIRRIGAERPGYGAGLLGRPRRGAGSGERGCPPCDGSGEWAAGLCVRLLFIGPEGAEYGLEVIRRLRAEGAGHCTGMICGASAVAVELASPLA